MKADIYNIQGKKSGSVELPENVFGVKWNDSLMHQVVVSMQSNARMSVAHTKGRGEVVGAAESPGSRRELAGRAMGLFALRYGKVEV